MLATLFEGVVYQDRLRLANLCAKCEVRCFTHFGVTKLESLGYHAAGIAR